MNKFIGGVILLFVCLSFIIVFVGGQGYVEDENNIKSGFDLTYDISECLSDHGDNLTELFAHTEAYFNNITPLLNFLAKDKNLPNIAKIAISVVFPFDFVVYPVVVFGVSAYSLVMVIKEVVVIVWDIFRIVSTYSGVEQEGFE